MPSFHGYANRALSRRRFLTICAAAGCAALPGRGWAGVLDEPEQIHRWRGIALGAGAEIRLRHRDKAAAERILARAHAEIRRLEDIFSLYRADSAVARLNGSGHLAEPPFELLELLSQCARLHRASDGAFDPTIQPLWAAYAESFAEGRPHPDAARLARARTLVGFERLAFDPQEIRFTAPGMGLTLNGIAQGYITDRVSDMLRAEGLTNVLVDLGEIRGSGDQQDGAGWPVLLDPTHEGDTRARIRLSDQAVASSAPLGTTFDQAGRLGHILDPRLGRPVETDLRGVSVIAPSATLADGLSTAALVLGAPAFEDRLTAFADTRARLLESDGTARWIGA